MFSFDGAKTKFQSVFGAGISVLLMILMLIYSTNKAVRMAQLEDVTVLQYIEEGALKAREEITDDKLNFGFGITTYMNPDFFMQDFPDYGTLEIYYETWNTTSDIYTPIKTKKCDLSMFEKQQSSVKAVEKDDVTKQHDGAAA